MKEDYEIEDEITRLENQIDGVREWGFSQKMTKVEKKFIEDTHIRIKALQWVMS